MSRKLAESNPSGMVAMPETATRLAAELPLHAADLARELMEVWPAVPGSLRPARAAFAGWLAGLHWAVDDAEDFLLAVNEAVANAIDHAYPSTRPGPVHLHSWCGPGSTPATRRVTAVIIDRGDWEPEHRTIDPAGHRGHGFVVMSGCTAQMHLERSPGGTTVILVSNDAPAR